MNEGRREHFSPFFIIGVPRSGTTLLRVILDSHSQIAGAPETAWIAGGYGRESLRELVEYLSEDKLGAVNNLEGVNFSTIRKASISFLENIFSDYMRVRNKQILVLKTPDDCAYVSFLKTIFPGSKFLHLVRDGRDVACSTVAKKGKFFSAKLKGYGELSFWSALQRWSDWEKTIRDVISKDDRITISYEYFVDNPHHSLRKICEFIGVDFEESMLEYWEKDHEYPKWEAGSFDVKEKSSIQTTSIGRWQNEVPNVCWEYIDELYGQALSKYGYSLCSQYEQGISNKNYYDFDKIILENYFFSDVQTFESSVIEKFIEEAENLKIKFPNVEKQPDLITSYSKNELSLKTCISDFNIKMIEKLIMKEKELLYQNERRMEELAEKDEKISHFKDISSKSLSEKDKKIGDLVSEANDNAELIRNLRIEVNRLRETNKKQAEKIKIKDELLSNLNQSNTWEKARYNQLKKSFECFFDVSLDLQKIIQKKDYQLDTIFNSRTFRIASRALYPARVIRQYSQLHKNSPKDIERENIKNYKSICSRGWKNNKFFEAIDRVKSIGESHSKEPYRPIDLGEQIFGYFGAHRSGWGFAICQLGPLHSPNSIYLDSFVERTHIWGPNKGEPILRSWIGFIHVPPNVPSWFQSEQANDEVFRTQTWLESYPYCKGLFTLSEYHKNALDKILDVPISALVHPTQDAKIRWSWDLFIQNPDKKLVQIGWWLRKLHAIFALPSSDYRKIMIRTTKNQYFQDLFKTEHDIMVREGSFTDSMYDSAEIIEYLPDIDYDQILSRNIVFVDLYDSSANNLVIECISRCCPMLVNPLEAVVEYLGKDYPFYYSTYEEAISKASDLNLVRDTHDFLKESDMHEKISGKYFRNSFLASEVISSI